MSCKAVMVAATRQHVGKTSVCMALLSGLQKMHGSVGYMKPVGQKFVYVGNGWKVDKDIQLAKEHFKLRCDYEHMSPVIVGRDYTKQFIDGKISFEKQVKAIRRSFEALTAENDFVVVEGTGHMGVGSVIGLSNAKVASLLGLDMILVVNGGVGCAIDEIDLNRALCQVHNVHMRGVIMNRVQPSKLEMVQHYASKALRERGIPLIAVVPEGEHFDAPSVLDLQNMLQCNVLSGKEHALRKFSSYQFVTTSLRRFMERLNTEPECNSACFVTHASRSDIVLGLLSHVGSMEDPKDFKGGMIITGSPPRNIPQKFLMKYIQQATFPVLNAHFSTTETMRLIKDYTAKLHPEDTCLVNKVIQQYEPHIDFSQVVDRGAATDPAMQAIAM